MKQVEIEVKISVIRKELTYWEDVLKNRSCASCEQFVQKVCKLAGIAPPPEVQTTGCPEWAFDDIPF